MCQDWRRNLTQIGRPGLAPGRERWDTLVMTSWREGVAREIPTDLSGELLDWLEESWQIFVDEHGGEQASHETLVKIEAKLEGFDLFRWPTPAQLLDAWITFDEPRVTVCLILRGYTAWSTGAGGIPMSTQAHEDRFAALFDLPGSVGVSATIRPETIGDKVSELFSRKEIDFDESPEFSSAYYLLATDETKVREVLSPRVLDCLATRRDLLVELRGREALVVWSERPSPRSTREAVAFFATLARRLHGAGAAPYR